MAEQIDLSIVIINWRSVEFLKACLASIKANTHGISFETIVVDNASFDGSDDVANGQPGVRFFQSDKNLGFAGANNLGVSHSRGNNLLFLNPDTEIIGEAIPILLFALTSTPDAGAIGCKLLNGDRTVQTSCIQSFPSILNQAVNTDYLRERFPRLSIWGMAPLFDGSGGLAEVEVISGACLMMRREVFEKLGGFSTRYFMYAEDVDLCYRARRLGWKSYYTGQAEVVHFGGKSSGAASQDQFGAIVMKESILRFLRTSRGRAYAFVFKVTTALVALFRLLLLVGARIAFVGRMNKRPITFAWAKWSKVLRWAVGLEGWARNLG